MSARKPPKAARGAARPGGAGVPTRGRGAPFPVGARALAAALRGADPARVQGGAAARAAGRAFEAELVATHDALVQLGAPLAVARAHPPVGGPPHALHYAGKGQVDFVGTFAGRGVSFDAKSVAGAATYTHDPRDVHELHFLRRTRAAGGLAFLLVRDPALHRVYLVDDLEALIAGHAVTLRRHAREGATPCVLSLQLREHDVALRLATGQPVWDWTSLVALDAPAPGRWRRA